GSFAYGHGASKFEVWRRHGGYHMASTIFRNARLIDSINDQPRDGVSIVVEGGRIGAVGGSEIPTPGNAAIVDLKGQTVLPGLIDTHVHTTLMDKNVCRSFWPPA